MHHCIDADGVLMALANFATTAWPVWTLNSSQHSCWSEPVIGLAEPSALHGVLELGPF